MAPLKIRPPAFLLISIILAVILNFSLPVAILLTSPWRLLGILLLVLGLAINLQADHAFHVAHTSVDPQGAASALVTYGPYRLSRNPMYLGFVLLLVGVSVVLGSLSPFLCVLAFGALMNRVIVPAEEQKLAAAFGPDWTSYERNVRRWL